jgi:hypothetical protein
MDLYTHFPIHLHDVVLSKHRENFTFFSILNFPEQVNFNIFDAKNEVNPYELLLVCSEYRPVERVNSKNYAATLIFGIIHSHT